MKSLLAQEQQFNKKDFFINCAPQDTAWARWVAWQLEEEHYQVILPDWDFLPGSNTILELHKAVMDTERTIAIFTPHYVNILHTLSDWTVTYKRDMAGEQKLLLPIRVLPCEAEGNLSTVRPIDIYGHDENTARQLLLDGIKKERAKSLKPPRFPGIQPQTFGITIDSNPLFVGREYALKVVHNTLHSNGVAVITHVLASSRGSVGKTEVAKEYLYRYQYYYNTVLWVQDTPFETSHSPLTKSLYDTLQQLHLPVRRSYHLTDLLLLLHRWLEENSDWLLVIDGMKQVEMLAELLSTSLHGHVLVTTRERATAAIAPLIELTDLTEEEKEQSKRLSKLIDTVFYSTDHEAFHIGPGNTTIGSAPDNVHVLNDSSIAPHHAIITSKEGNYFITDLEGSTGTFVNQQRLTPGILCLLKPKDVIRLGNIQWGYASDIAQVTFESVAPHRATGQQKIQTADPSRIEDPQEIIRRARQITPPKDWDVLRSERTSFPEFRQLILNLKEMLLHAALLLIFLSVGTLPFLIMLAQNLTILSFVFFLCIMLADIVAIGFFAFTVTEKVQQMPLEAITPPFENALLVLTPYGFVEYIDAQEDIDCVSYADIVLIKIHQEEDHADWISLLDQDGQELQWSPHAYYHKSPRYVTQQILESFARYIRTYKSA